MNFFKINRDHFINLDLVAHVNFRRRQGEIVGASVSFVSPKPGEREKTIEIDDEHAAQGLSRFLEDWSGS